MGRLQPRHEGEEDEDISTTVDTCAERGACEHGASARGIARRGVAVLRILAALTGIRGVSADITVETPRDLCIQAIQTAIIDRTRDLFEQIYLPNRHQRPHVLYQLAEHTNFGDTFIDRGEELFLARIGLEPTAECSAFMAASLMATCEHDEIQSLIQGNATVMFHGGGNWGDIWPKPHGLRMRDLAKLSVRPGMNLVTMPNSLKYYNQAAREKDEEIVAGIVDAKHPTTRITFLFRQRDSYDTAKLMFPGVDVRLVPDIAFMMGPLLRVGSEKFKYDIVFLARRDKEGDTDKKVKQAIIDEMARRAPHLTYFVGDWNDNPTDKKLIYGHRVHESNVPALRHGVVLDATMKYFSTAKVMVCDRLHASVLALLMGIPHVVVDGGVDTPSYGKRVMTRRAAFETSDHCTQSSLRYREASTLIDGIDAALELLDEFF